MAVKERTSLYEGMYILSTTLSEDARKKALDRITSGITDRGGVIEKIHDQGRRKLAYEIRGRREGYYFLLYFTAPNQSIKELWEDYNLNEDLLRFVILKAEKVMEEIKFKPLTSE